MDDVITVTAKDDGAWDVDRFREDFRRSECYWATLKLEAAENAHFLETTLELEANGGFRTRLKNVNEGCEADRASGVALPSLGQLHMHAQR